MKKKKYFQNGLKKHNENNELKSKSFKKKCKHEMRNVNLKQLNEKILST